MSSFSQLVFYFDTGEELFFAGECSVISIPKSKSITVRRGGELAGVVYKEHLLAYYYK